MATDMSPSANPSAQQDESAVAAVRKGDAERYRELVERHERRVYAVAWSRLGDAGLAEEVTQEAFIRAYRRIWMLGDGTKFSAWIAAIARRMAINFGLRHRRELNKRERWALEQDSMAVRENTDPEDRSACTPENLKQTLSKLPAAHRECLVLFYLEGKSGAEAAEALGISETALRVRLHRARTALRERLEKKLEASLQALKPGRTLVPGIMAGVLASSSGKAATAGGLGAALSGVLAKFGVTKWLLPLGSLLAFVWLLPMLGMGWLMTQLETRNFRDQKGFRVRMFRDSMKDRLLLIVTIGMASLILIPLIGHWVERGNFSGITGKTQFLIIAAVVAIFLPFSIRQLTINRNRFFMASLAGSLLMMTACLLAGLSLMPPSGVNFFIFGMAFLTLPFYGHRPIRMDYNLFLRAAENLFPANMEMIPGPRRSRTELLAFARFLGTRWLANQFRWTPEGLCLRLPPVTFSQWTGWTDLMWNWSWRKRSQIQLAWNGTVSAKFGKRDQRALAKYHDHAQCDPVALEARVDGAVTTAWRLFAAQNLPSAERALGQVPENDVFVTSPAKGGMARVRWLMAVLLGLLFLSSIGLHIPGCREQLERLNGLKPVDLSRQQATAFLNDSTPNPNPNKFAPNSPVTALDQCLVLPGSNLFTAEGLSNMRERIYRASGFAPLGDKQEKLSAFRGAWLLHKAMEDGWIYWENIGLKPADATAYFHQLKPNAWHFALARERAWSWVKRTEWDVKRINDFTLNQLRWLRDVNCLDLINRKKLIRQIALVQVRSGRPPGNPPIHDWRDVRGLFFTPCWPALQDTYYSLAALKILGGLDMIDREACIEGIL